MASFFNGGFPSTSEKYFNSDRIHNQFRAISQGRTINPFHGDDRNNQDAELFYALAAPATIESFRVGGKDKRDHIPRRIAFAVSMSPAGNFQTVAEFAMPESAVARASYDFLIPAQRKISGRYLRVTLSPPPGKKYAQYRLSRFSALGRFDQPVELREDFSGIYRTYGSKDAASPANTAMVEQQKGTSYFPYLILHQNGSQMSGCYVYGASSGGGKLFLREISEVNGTFTGGVENNVFRFTRTYAGDGSQNRGAMALFPVAENITQGDYRLVGYLLVERDTEGKEGEGAFRVDLTRFSNTPAPCAVTGQKEKSADEVMAENLEKTGKVQLYGVNFDFDSDTLRPESGAVLDEVVKLARANPTWKFEIGGHTDSLGSAEYNRKLSERRAAAVARYLTGKGVDVARLQAKGYGASRPLVPEKDGNEAARAQNRRVELVKP
ncbi:MAG: OmpA family protein [Candidatus Accumulibacter sp.]|nr:OmpA family protein [Accumulibacter sp.]